MPRWWEEGIGPWLMELQGRVVCCGQASFWVETGELRILGCTYTAANCGAGRAKSLFSPKSSGLLQLESAGGCRVHFRALRGNGLGAIEGCQAAFGDIFSAGAGWREVVGGLWMMGVEEAQGAGVAVVQVPAAWEALAEEVLSAPGRPVVLVCGQRKVGKSTFSRYLTNRLLSAIGDDGELGEVGDVGEVGGNGDAGKNVGMDAGMDADSYNHSHTPTSTPTHTHTYTNTNTSTSTYTSTHGYRHVQYLDLDVGQSEWMPSGFVSLHEVPRAQALAGPPFTHLTVQPRAARYLGTTSPGENPRLFCAAVQSLLAEARADAPLIVNCMGWMTGLGYELLQFCLHCVRPTHVAAFTEQPQTAHDDVLLRAYTTPSVLFRGDGKGGRAGTPPQPQPLPVPRVAYLDSAVPEGVRAACSPSDQRSLAFWAYFFGAADAGSAVLSRFDFAPALSGLRARAVPLRRLQVLSTSRDAALYAADATCARWLHRALAMRVVGLAHDPRFRPRADGALHVPRWGVARLAALPSFGLGLVRGVEAQEDGQLAVLLLTPLPPALLRALRINTLLLGALTLPGHLFNADLRAVAAAGVAPDAAPFYSLQGCVDADTADVPVGSSVHKARHNIKRVK